MRYRFKVWYAATDENSPQIESGLSGEQIMQAAGAFVRDLAHLEGRGVRRVTLEIESSEP